MLKIMNLSCGPEFTSGFLFNVLYDLTTYDVLLGHIGALKCKLCELSGLIMDSC